jgi:hypothetical protein
MQKCPETLGLLKIEEVRPALGGEHVASSTISDLRASGCAFHGYSTKDNPSDWEWRETNARRD